MVKQSLAALALTISLPLLAADGTAVAIDPRTTGELPATWTARREVEGDLEVTDRLGPDAVAGTLTALGETSLLAETEAEYVALAIALAVRKRDGQADATAAVSDAPADDVPAAAAEGPASLVRAFVAEGARVAIADLNLDAAKAAAKELGGDKEAIAVAMDVTKEDEVNAGVEATVSAAKVPAGTPSGSPW